MSFAPPSANDLWPQAPSADLRQEGEALIQKLSAHVKQVDMAVRELSERVQNLLDNVTSVKCTSEAIASVKQSKGAIDDCKVVQRQLAIFLAGATLASPQLRLQRDKLTGDLERNVVTFNEHSKKLDAALRKRQATPIEELGTPPLILSADTSTSTTIPDLQGGPSGASLSSFDDARACLHGLRSVQSNIVATQQIFDELGSLVRQQAPHLDTLENAAATTKGYTKGAAGELTRAYLARQRRTRRRWMCAITLAVLLCCVLWVISDRSSIRRRHSRFVQNGDPNVAQESPAKLRKSAKHDDKALSKRSET